MYKKFCNALTPSGVWNQKFWLIGLSLAVVIGIATFLLVSFALQPMNMSLVFGLIAFGCIAGPSLLFSSYIGC
ncbi:MAG TPA: hypothetical protein VJJ02_00350 [Candidatus Paceibacterota bacterium]